MVVMTSSICLTSSINNPFVVVDCYQNNSTAVLLPVEIYSNTKGAKDKGEMQRKLLAEINNSIAKHLRNLRF